MFQREWSPAAIELAIVAGWREARAAIVFYAFEYDPDLIANRAAPFTFIGTVNLGSN